MNTTQPNHRSLVLLLTLAAVALNLATPRETNALPFAGRTPANKLTASDAEDNDWFGRSVAISGNLAIVGAEREDGSGSGNDNPGAA